MVSALEKKCIDSGLKMTEQRRVIARVLGDSSDHPDVELLHKRAHKVDAFVPEHEAQVCLRPAQPRKISAC